MNEKGIIGGVVVLLLVVGGILFVVTGGSTTSGTAGTSGAVASAYAPKLAQCLKDSGVTFFGAFWCPHCQRQKSLFGDAVEALPYVECSMPDGNSQTQICKDKKIESYPTWEFKDGSRLTGEQTFDVLAAKAGCPLPNGGESTAVSPVPPEASVVPSVSGQ